jgi:hypothetical protein
MQKVGDIIAAFNEHKLSKTMDLCKLGPIRKTKGLRRI